MGAPEQPRAQPQHGADRAGEDQADGTVGIHGAAAPTGLGGQLAAWGPVVLWMVVITWLSGDQFSDEQTASWLAGAPLLSALGLSPAAIDTANLILRKSTHFVEYATLAWLAAGALAASAPARSPAVRLLGALLLAVAWAGFDELHQTLTASRSGTLHDVVIDAAGAAAGALVAARWSVRRPRSAP